jgi:hypothetical protein
MGICTRLHSGWDGETRFGVEGKNRNLKASEIHMNCYTQGKKQFLYQFTEKLDSTDTLPITKIPCAGKTYFLLPVPAPSIPLQHVSTCIGLSHIYILTM